MILSTFIIAFLTIKIIKILSLLCILSVPIYFLIIYLNLLKAGYNASRPSRISKKLSNFPFTNCSNQEYRVVSKKIRSFISDINISKPSTLRLTGREINVLRVRREEFKSKYFTPEYYSIIDTSVTERKLYIPYPYKLIGFLDQTVSIKFNSSQPNRIEAIKYLKRKNKKRKFDVKPEIIDFHKLKLIHYIFTANSSVDERRIFIIAVKNIRSISVANSEMTFVA
ncbi:MAG: hypothetical protein WA902_14415 [Thermosynechococcaceae cyanobacterium]